MSHAATDSRIQDQRPSALAPCAGSPLLDLRLADCMAVMREMPDYAYDLAIVDPPYGIGEDRGTPARLEASNHLGRQLLPAAAFEVLAILGQAHGWRLCRR
jgi:hypothetical protein